MLCNCARQALRHLRETSRFSLDDTLHRWEAAYIAAAQQLTHGNISQREDFPELFVGPARRMRRRDGFKLTDRRYSEKQALAEVDYCIFCHAQGNISQAAKLLGINRTTLYNRIDALARSQDQAPLIRNR